MPYARKRTYNSYRRRGSGRKYASKGTIVKKQRVYHSLPVGTKGAAEVNYVQYAVTHWMGNPSNAPILVTTNGSAPSNANRAWNLAAVGSARNNRIGKVTKGIKFDLTLTCVPKNFTSPNTFIETFPSGVTIYYWIVWDASPNLSTTAPTWNDVWAGDNVGAWIPGSKRNTNKVDRFKVLKFIKMVFTPGVPCTADGEFILNTPWNTKYGDDKSGAAYPDDCAEGALLIFRAQSTPPVLSADGSALQCSMTSKFYYNP